MPGCDYACHAVRWRHHLQRVVRGAQQRYILERNILVNQIRRVACMLAMVATLLLGASSGTVHAAPQATVNALFRPLLAHLHGLLIPVLLPTLVPHQHDAGVHLYAAVDDKTQWGYLVDIGYTPQCGGAGACRFGSVTGGAEIDSPTIFDYPRAQHVHLQNGAQALFFPYTCGASCGDSVLAFQVEGFVYTVTIKAGSLRDVLTMANSVTTAVTP